MSLLTNLQDSTTDFSNSTSIVQEVYGNHTQFKQLLLDSTKELGITHVGCTKPAVAHNSNGKNYLLFKFMKNGVEVKEMFVSTGSSVGVGTPVEDLTYTLCRLSDGNDVVLALNSVNRLN